MVPLGSWKEVWRGGWGGAAVELRIAAAAALREQPEVRSQGSCRHTFSAQDSELSEALPWPLDGFADTS